MRIASVVLCLPLCFDALACSSGSSPDDQTPSGSTGDNLADYASTWDGYAEAWQFASGSDRVRLVLDATGAGTLEAGDVPAWPAATDPDVGYPPGETSPPYGTLEEGFAYPVYNAIVESGRIRLGLDPLDLYAGWCALQTPVLDEWNTQEPMYNCLPNWSFSTSPAGCSQDNSQTQEHVAVDCGKLALCTMAHVCSCTAAGCSIPPAAAPFEVQLDAALGDNGSALEGTLVLYGSTRVTVRLSRK